MYHKIKQKWAESSARTRLAAKNIIISIFLKITSILTSLLIVPLTIDYINGDVYGIWLTISSIVGWINFFDLGLANGFKNKFAESLARNNHLLARQYLSTTYFFVIIIMCFVFGVAFILNKHLDLASILNVSQIYRITLQKVFIILSFFFCMNMIVNIFAKMVEADQRPSIAAIISCIGQILSLIAIYILTKTTSGNLVNLATYFSGIPFFTMLISSLILYKFTRYRNYAPSIKYCKFYLIKDLLHLGVKFFIIYLSLIVIFQLMNVVLSRECGPLAVTQYNISYKYFSVIYMAFVIIVSPMWAAFTDAYAKKDNIWMQSTLNKFEKCLVFILMICGFMLLFSQTAYHIWIRNKVEISWTLSIGTTIYVIAQIYGALYMNLINGIGSIRIQLIIYVSFALISFPLMTWACRQFGPVGIVVIPTIVYITQSLLLRKQLKLIIADKASGIWTK